MTATPDFSFLNNDSNDEDSNEPVPDGALDFLNAGKTSESSEAEAIDAEQEKAESEDETEPVAEAQETVADVDDQEDDVDESAQTIELPEEFPQAPVETQAQRPEFELYEKHAEQEKSEPDTNPELEIPSELLNQQDDDPDTQLIDTSEVFGDVPEQPGILSPENVNWSPEDSASDQDQTEAAESSDEDASEAVEEESENADPALVAAGVTDAAAAVVSKTVEVKDPAEAKPSRTKGRGKKTAAASGGKPSTLLVSYASIMTLLCLYLLYQSTTAKPHNLESLPDIKPPMQDDEIGYQQVPEGESLPAGHDLKLGQSQRYGNLKVTPIKVVKQNLEFQHYGGSERGTREPDGPVLKLWLRFENVSDKQTFAPIDRKLLLTRIADTHDLSWVRSNQFLAASSQQGVPGKQYGIYDLEMFGDFDFAGVENQPVLKPGETLDVYFPSDPQATKLSEEIVWRIQFRKGYHPKSKRGVTTLVDVHFHASEIQAG